MQSVERNQRHADREAREARIAALALEAENAAHVAAAAPNDQGAQRAAAAAQAAAVAAQLPENIIEEDEFLDPTENLAERFARTDIKIPPMDTLKPIEIPKPGYFDGGANPTITLEQFLCSTEQYLRVANVKSASLQVYVAGGLLAGNALAWYQAAMQSTDPQSSSKT